jgi:hypothetical protein
MIVLPAFSLGESLTSRHRAGGLLFVTGAKIIANA